jgi:lipopolysaccharide/colanic/teichoic acid biosynthesis glycosyltransferase
MIIASWLSGFARSAVTKSRLRSDFLLGAEQLAHMAICERSRVDRNGSILSILRTTRALSSVPRANLSLASEQLQLRLRITDSVGLAGDGKLMLLLPDTPMAGAIHVADDLRRILSTSLGGIEFEIATYPDEFAGDDDSSMQQLVSIDQKEHCLPHPSGLQLTGDQSVTGAHRIESAEALFARRCPAWKRVIDVVGASVGIVAVAPVIGAAAILIRVTSPGGAFFVQRREGMGGQSFQVYKLRTMRPDAESLKDDLRAYSEQDGPAFKMTNDPRITSIGRFLRKTSIDELPQLWNVLKGDMSLVGPRPLPVDESQSCQRWQRRRLSVRPGLTCIWQIRGRNSVSFDEWVRMDLKYIKRRSFWYDLYLIAITAHAVVAKRDGR